MQRNIKIGFLFKHTWKMIFSNIPRLLLSMGGLFLGLLILCVGAILVESYYLERLSKAEEYAENTIFLELEGEQEQINKIIENVEGQHISRKIIPDEREVIYSQSYSNGFNLVMNGCLIGTSNMQDNKILGKINENVYVPYDATLIAGRFINSNDIATEKEVVVIDEFTASILFKSENPIGKKIKLDVSITGNVVVDANGTGDEGIKELEVVGVYLNEKVVKDNGLEYNKFISNGNDELHLHSDMYIPDSVCKKIYDTSKQSYIFTCGSGDEYEKTLNLLKEYQNKFSSRFVVFDIITKDDVINREQEGINYIKTFMGIVLGVLLTIAGVNSMNTMFFSVKERIDEIGIKKSMGASKVQIVIQFMLEGIVMSLMAGVIALISGIFISEIIADIIQEKLYISFTIQYSPQIGLGCIAIALLYGIIFSFLPSYYGARIKVTDALRFE